MHKRERSRLVINAAVVAQRWRRRYYDGGLVSAVLCRWRRVVFCYGREIGLVPLGEKCDIIEKYTDMNKARLVEKDLPRTVKFPTRRISSVGHPVIIYVLLVEGTCTCT